MYIYMYIYIYVYIYIHIISDLTEHMTDGIARVWALNPKPLNPQIPQNLGGRRHSPHGSEGAAAASAAGWDFGV